MKVEVRYNERGRRRFYQKGFLDKHLIQKANLNLNPEDKLDPEQDGSGVEGMRATLKGYGVDYEEKSGNGFTQWIFDKNQMGWKKRTAFLIEMKTFKKRFRKDPDMGNMIIK